MNDEVTPPPIDPNTLLLAAIVVQLQPLARYFTGGTIRQADAVRDIPHRLQLELEKAGHVELADLIEKMFALAPVPPAPPGQAP